MKSATFLLLFCAFAIKTSAQLCTGIPGPLVYSEDFGTGSFDLGPALPPGSTTYNFGSIGPGNYVVVNNCGVNGSFWFSAPDHTPNDVDGYMLVFDASVEPGIFFKKYISGLCGGSRYTFSAWVMNIQIPGDCLGQEVRPDILFQVQDVNSGTVLGQTATGQVPLTSTPTWTQYALTFGVPIGQTAVEVVLSNNAKGACGNDLAIDDFEFYLCNPLNTQDFTLCAGESIQVGNHVYTKAGQYIDLIPVGNGCNDSTVITNIHWLTPPFEQQVHLCQGDTLKVLNHVYTKSGVYQDLIERPGCDSVIISYLTVHETDTTRQSFYLCQGDTIHVGSNAYFEPGVFTTHLSGQMGCDSVVITSIITDVPLTVSVSPKIVELELGESVQLNLNLSRKNNLSLLWTPASGLSCSNCPDPTAMPTENTTYIVRAADTLSTCVAEDTVMINILACKGIFIPNVFSPNDDGQNDYFTIYTRPCIREIKLLEIFDRWGSKVFLQTNFSPNEDKFGWNGMKDNRLSPEGVYVYKVELELFGGQTKILSGTLTLLR